MSNINKIESGERLSFYQLFKEKSYKIEIPIIQRDYAQGRETSKEVRNDFLKVLKRYILEDKPNRDLDFIYGSIIPDKDSIFYRFIPLDGQQRLTTLFLLHWYIASKENKYNSFKEIFAYKIKVNDELKWNSKFTYETRTSAKEFCDALVSSEIIMTKLLFDKENKKYSLSKTIKNQSWYFLSWKNDPTIKGMLVMLDAIHNLFFKMENLYSKLINTKHRIITFQFLELEEFGLSDDLYIKMNARGKPLTAFENFKAKLEQFIKISEFNNLSKYSISYHKININVSMQEYFSFMIDSIWANLFWAYIPKEKNENNNVSFVFDEIIMNIIRTLAINNIANKSKSEYHIKQLIKLNIKDLSYSKFVESDSLNEKLIKDIITIFDLFVNGNLEAKKYLPDFYYYDENIFISFLKNKYRTAAYVERIQFYAFYQYLIKWQRNNNFNDIEGLKKWMRVIHNLTVNTAPYNSEKEFSNSIIGINRIIENSNKIHDILIENVDISNFDDYQIQEERYKALLIEKNSEWEKNIYTAEQYGYFKGQIGFLLRLSGIIEYFEQNGNFDWNENLDNGFKEKFNQHFNTAKNIFSEKGIRSELSKNGEYIWERALLSLDDYLIEEGSNQSFLINNDRDISWKRMLKADKLKSHIKLTKTIFDTLKDLNVKKGLEEIRSQSNVSDWRKEFIDCPKLFDSLGTQRYVRSNSKHGFVLLSRIIMSSTHVELYSYSFFLKNKNESFLPFTKIHYKKVSGADVDDCPYFYLDGIVNTSLAMEVRVLRNKYVIRFFDRKNIDFNNNIISLLKSNGFEKSEKYKDNSYLRSLEIKSNLKNNLQDFSKELKNIQQWTK